MNSLVFHRISNTSLWTDHIHRLIPVHVETLIWWLQREWKPNVPCHASAVRLFSKSNNLFFWILLSRFVFPRLLKYLLFGVTSPIFRIKLKHCASYSASRSSTASQAKTLLKSCYCIRMKMLGAALATSNSVCCIESYRHANKLIPTFPVLDNCIATGKYIMYVNHDTCM